MRKLWMSIVAILVLAAVTTGALAAGCGYSGRRGRCAGNESCAGNGCQYVNEDADGICDHRGDGAGMNCDCTFFVDEDGDGVCDLWGAGTQRCNGARWSCLRQGRCGK